MALREFRKQGGLSCTLRFSGQTSLISLVWSSHSACDSHALFMQSQQWKCQSLSVLLHWRPAEEEHNLRRCQFYGSEAAVLCLGYLLRSILVNWIRPWHEDGAELLQKLGTCNFLCFWSLACHPWVSSGANVQSFRKLGWEGSRNCAWIHLMVIVFTKIHSVLSNIAI